MALIETIFVPASALGRTDWGALMQAVRAWVQDRGVEPSQCVVLVPFAQHLGLARQAWAQGGGWMPRVETTQTLARALAPMPVWRAGQISFELATDQLQAAHLLRGTAWGRAWFARDAQGFASAVTALVQAAHALARAAASVPPGEREAYWSLARNTLSPAAQTASPDGLERHLAAVAVQWAALGPEPASDVLFFHRPSAWIVVQAGGEDPLARAILAHADVPCAVLDGDPSFEAASCAAPDERISLAACDGFEQEAQCVAAQLITSINQGQWPVALAAQDRVLVRRVRALLAQAGVAVSDETGWTLSTTRAAAQLMSVLRAAQPQASTDALVDWLKACTAPWPELGAIAPAALAIERSCRRFKWRRSAQIDAGALCDRGRSLWLAASQVLARVREGGSRTLVAWREQLQAALVDCGLAEALAADEAGRQVLAALGAAPWLDQVLSFEDWVRWVDAVLESAAFVPPGPAAAPQVVIAPLARLMLRPFAALVLPGADDRHLGAPPALLALVNDRQAETLGLPSVASRLKSERVALAHALGAPTVMLSYRRLDGDEPQSCSPLVEALRSARRRTELSLPAWRDPRQPASVPSLPSTRPEPSAPALVPEMLSASACEALRACPYRFFALYMLKVSEADELEVELTPRDQGTWLHNVLHVFHRDRAAPADAASEIARLVHEGEVQRRLQGWSDADFLPMAAGLAALAPRYIAWLHARDAQGAHWLHGERECRVQPAALGGATLQGRIDRVDVVPAEGGSGLELIDYKSGGISDHKNKVRTPYEDTQLAVYAALVAFSPEGVWPDWPVRAQYLALGGGNKPVESAEHPEVSESALALVEGLGHDLSRLRAGMPLRPLGEGAMCESCSVRGLCRKDDWA